MARAFGSYPECRWFESDRRYQKSNAGNPLEKAGFALYRPVQPRGRLHLPGFPGILRLPYVMSGLVRFHGVNPVRSGRKQQ